MVELVIDIGDVELPVGTIRGEWRLPAIGEYCLSGNGKPYKAQASSAPAICLVLEKPHEWPACIKSGTWIAVDRNVQIYAFTHKPIMSGAYWLAEAGNVYSIGKLLDIELPKYTSWKEACWQIIHPAKAE